MYCTPLKHLLLSSTHPGNLSTTRLKGCLSGSIPTINLSFQILKKTENTSAMFLEAAMGVALHAVARVNANSHAYMGLS